MTVEAHPVGVRCNLSCKYCYENPTRLHEKAQPVQLEHMLATLKNVGPNFTVFGGEPLLTPLPLLERFFKNGGNGVQTNGTMITERHIELFKKYNVHVGVSVDGPDEMNDARVIGDLETTRKATEATHTAIRRLLENRIGMSLIITLHKLNVSEERRPRFKKWVKYLESIGVPDVRFHLLENDDADDIKLSEEESIAAVLDLLQFVQTLNTLKVDLFDEMERSLKGEDNVVCIWDGCDPYTTPAVQAVDADGSLSNCQRTYKDGVPYRKADSRGNERQLALWHTPQEYGGCKGCRFFSACKGECPGTGIGGDWRNRTEHCGTLKAIFAELEKKIVASGGKIREAVEPMMPGDNAHVDSHGDSHADVPHGDRYDFGVVEVKQSHDDIHGDDGRIDHNPRKP